MAQTSPNQRSPYNQREISRRKNNTERNLLRNMTLSNPSIPTTTLPMHQGELSEMNNNSDDAKAIELPSQTIDQAAPRIKRVFNTSYVFLAGQIHIHVLCNTCKLISNRIMNILFI